MFTREEIAATYLRDNGKEATPEILNLLMVLMPIAAAKYDDGYKQGYRDALIAQGMQVPGVAWQPTGEAAS